MCLHQFGNRFACCCHDIEPHQHGPNAVFFADVVGAGAKAFFATKCDASVVEQVAEEFPACGCLVTFHAHCSRNAVNRGRGRHRARDTFEALRITGCEVCVGGDDGEAV